MSQLEKLGVNLNNLLIHLYGMYVVSWPSQFLLCGTLPAQSGFLMGR